MTLEATQEVSDNIRLLPMPLVSVLMITYNHAEYLAEAIEGVINQRCDFPFELIIGEDASTDATLRVALNYQKRYPELIRVVYAEGNIGMNANARRIFTRARGKYIAYCEGDDFWCAQDKLARQVALIESDCRIGIVHSDWVRAHFRNGRWNFNLRKSVHRRVPARYLSGDLFSTWHFPKVLRTCTVLLRKETVQTFLDSDLAKGEYRFGDSVLNAFVTSRWKVAYLPVVASVYRVSPHSALRSGADSRVHFYKSCLQFDTDARAFFAGTANYQLGYRWDSAAGLFVWGIRAHKFNAVKVSLVDFWYNFTCMTFIITGWKTVIMRLPSLRRQSREIPELHIACTKGMQE